MRGVKIPVKRSQAKGGLSPDLLAEYVLRGPQSGLKSPLPVGTPALYLGQASEPNLASFARLPCAYAVMPGLKRQIGMLGFLYLQHGASQQSALL